MSDSGFAVLQTRECGRSHEDGGGTAPDQAPGAQFRAPKEKAARSTANKNDHRAINARF
jgi:hypothetical protein